MFAILFFLFLSVSVQAGSENKYVLKNPSFETEVKDGSPNGWETNPQYYSLTFDTARTGNASLRWQDIGHDYIFCSQKTGLLPGDIVDFSVWVKTKDLKNGFAQICLEWKNQYGHNEGAYVTSQVTGTTKNWTKIGGIAIIPEGARDVYLRCFATDGSTGTAWFDDAELRRPEYKLFSGMTTDRYRHQAIAEIMTIDVGICPSVEGLDIKKLDARLTLVKIPDESENFSSDKKTNEPVVKKKVSVKAGSADDETAFIDLLPNRRGKDFLEYKIDAGKLAPGKYRAICRAVNPSNGKKEETGLTITRLIQRPDYRCYVDRDLRFILDGKPFFPLGMYILAPQEKDINQMASAGFNCLLSYSLVNKKMLDCIDARKMKIIYSFQNKIPNGPDSDKNAAFEKLISDLKTHRSIIAWYINDEIPLTRLPELIYRRDLLEKLDPQRPTLTVLCQSNEIRYYLPSLDIVGTDPYPIPRKPAFVAAEWTRQTREGVMNRHAVWQVPQLFNWAAHRNDPKIKKAYRAPHYDEIRGMSWMCIANGANGLLYYSWHSLLRMDKTIEEGGQALVREPFEDRWKDVAKMSAEIKNWIPVLLMKPAPLKIEPDKKNIPQILFRAYGSEQDVFLLIVNGAPDRQKAVFKIPSGYAVQTTKMPPLSFEQNGDNISIVLNGLQPCFLQLKKK